MDMRLALYELAATHELDAQGADRLHRLAGLQTELAALC